MRFPSHEYAYEDVALASLFVACKAEDTIKKSKEILCAAHNLRQPHDHKTPDDKVESGTYLHPSTIADISTRSSNHKPGLLSA